MAVYYSTLFFCSLREVSTSILPRMQVFLLVLLQKYLYVQIRVKELYNGRNIKTCTCYICTPPNSVYVQEIQTNFVFHVVCSDAHSTIISHNSNTVGAVLSKENIE